MRYFWVVTLWAVCFGVPAMADLTLTNGSVIRFSDNTTMSTASPSDHGGTGTSVSGTDSFIGGGKGNLVTDDFGTVGGGYYNQAGDDAGVASDAPGATVGGGYVNTASGYASTVAGGSFNYAIGQESTVSGGVINTAAGDWATVGGGGFNSAYGDYSFVAGYFGDDLGHNYSFVWGGGTGLRTSAGVDTFNVWSAGGIYLNGALHAASDRNMKEAFSFVSARDVLDKVLEMPVSTWRFKSEDESVRHIGPVAQDFMEIFGYGVDDKHITATDADGVALVAIQGLNAKLEDTREDLAAQAEINTALRWQNAQLQAILRSRDESLEARFARLEKAILKDED